jgi:hypothetical protein
VPRFRALSLSILLTSKAVNFKTFSGPRIDVYVDLGHSISFLFDLPFSHPR